MVVEIKNNADEIYFVGNPDKVTKDELEAAYEAIEKIRVATSCKKVAVYITW
jgi:deoxyribose-phosphate aldolase